MDLKIINKIDKTLASRLRKKKRLRLLKIGSERGDIINSTEIRKAKEGTMDNCTLNKLDNLDEMENFLKHKIYRD